MDDELLPTLYCGVRAWLGRVDHRRQVSQVNFIDPTTGQQPNAGNPMISGEVMEPGEAGASPLQVPRLLDGCKYQVGDRVKVLPTAFEDIGTLAWPTIMGWAGTVKDGQAREKDGYAYIVYAVEFDSPFKGGFNCWGHTMPGRGQFVSQQHLELV